MNLTSPACITSRLLPGVRLGDGSEVSIEYAPRPGRDGRTRYRYFIDAPGVSIDGDDLQSGCQGGTLRDGLASLLGFLAAFGEAIGYQTRTGRASENADLFPAQLAEWGASVGEECAALACELEENPEAMEE